jgi:hypothetical protein
MKLAALTLLLALVLSGCGGKTVYVNKDGDPVKTVTVVEKKTVYKTEKERKPSFECILDRDSSASSEVNASGNVCYVKDGDTLCIAVLPDGGKAPKYADYTTCEKVGK